MGWFSDLVDPGGLVSGGNSLSETLGNVFDPGGTLLSNVGAMPSFYNNARDNLENWGDNIIDFEKSQLSDWTKRFKNDPTQLLIGAGDPFSAKMWGGITGKEYTPYVNQFGGPTNDAYRSAESKGVDTSDSRGSHQMAQLIASYYGTAGLGAGLGAAGNAAGIGAGAGQTLGGAAVGAGNAWANDGNVWQSAAAGALPGLSGLFGGALNGVNTGTLGDTMATVGDYYKQANDATGGYLGAVGGSALRGAVQGAGKGDWKGGATQGALTGLAGQGLGQGMQMFDNYMSSGQPMANLDSGLNYTGNFNAPAAQPSTPNYGQMGNALASGLMGLYGAQRAKKDINSQINGLQSLFGQNSAYSQQLQQQLARKDAAAGRRSQYGNREVELQARLAELNSRNAPQLQSLFNQRSAADVSQYKDLYNVLRQTGLLDKLGSVATSYFGS